MLNVQMSKGVLEPASENLRSETRIACKLAEAVLKENTTVDWTAMRNDYDVIRESIARVVEGCENYNRKVRVKGGFYLPNKPYEGEFPTDSGKAKFIDSRLPKIELKSGEMILTTIRSHDQFNTIIYIKKTTAIAASTARGALCLRTKTTFANVSYKPDK